MMTNFLSFKFKWLLVSLVLLTLSIGQVWGYTYTRLESIGDIDANAIYVLGIDGTGFHYDGTSGWGKTASPSSQTPYYYTLTPNNNKTSFTAQTTIGNSSYYLQVPTSNDFSMTTSSTASNRTLIIGTTQSNAGNDKVYAVANSNSTNRHLRRNGSSGLRSYAGNTGALAFFYKVSCADPTSLTKGTIASNTAQLSWTDNTNSNCSYEVYRSTDDETPLTTATPTITVNTKSVELTGLDESTTYYWWVRAKDKSNGAIKSAWVAGSSFTTASAAACTKDPSVSSSEKGSFFVPYFSPKLHRINLDVLSVHSRKIIFHHIIMSKGVSRCF